MWRKNEITGKFERLQLSSILVLKWSYTKAEDFRQYMDIRRPTFCDFGRLLKSMDSISPDVFEPYTYQKPGQFEKWQLKGKGTIGYKIIACADYFSSKSIYIMVDWDGKWVKYTGDWKKSEHTPEEMREHFKIRQIPENEFNREIGNIANSTNS